MNKYRNIKTVKDGIKFDSNAEATMYQYLKIMEKSGVINNLVLQPKYTLLTGYTDLKGKKIRDITYLADFSFYDKEKKRFRVIDCKGMKTEVFKIKEKMFNKLMLEQKIQIEYDL